jgi:non-homologous end joining protein Ku
VIKAKQAGKEPPKAPAAKPSNVINLMDALRRSAKAERRTPARRKSVSRAKRQNGRRKVRKAG